MPGWGKQEYDALVRIATAQSEQNKIFSEMKEEFKQIADSLKRLER